MQEAGNLASQRNRLWQVPQRARGIEKLTLQLRRDRVPLHDDDRFEAPQNMLLALSDSLAVEALSNDLVLGRVLRMDYLVVFPPASLRFALNG